MTVHILTGDLFDCLPTLTEKSVHMVATSPPYWGLRSYLPADHPLKSREIGQEKRLDCLGWTRGDNCGVCYICVIRNVGRELWRVLRDDGTLWIVQGDSYHNGDKGGYQPSRVKAEDSMQASNLASDITGGGANRHPQPGLKPKDRCGQPERITLALQADGWYWRDKVVWHKKSCMPGSQRDRCTVSHEDVLMFTKQERYFYDRDAIAEPVSESMLAQIEQGYDGEATKDYDAAGVQNPSAVKARILHNQTRALRARDGAKCAPTDERNGVRPKRSGNKERKFGESRGRPDSHLGASIPWEGFTRTKRSVWTLGPEPFKEEHFATYPCDLVEPMILAGTSAHGCCAKCGAPWERETNTEREFRSGSGQSGNLPEGKNRQMQGGGETLDVRRGPTTTTTTTTTGWRPTCGCNCAQVVPATVLDPFGGAGTTALVADRHHRDAISIELYDKHVGMQQRRIVGESPLFAQVGT